MHARAQYHRAARSHGERPDLWRPHQPLNTCTPQLRGLMLYPVELCGRPRHQPQRHRPELSGAHKRGRLVQGRSTQQRPVHADCGGQPGRASQRRPDVTLNFTNQSRSYDATRHAVRFWGYDQGPRTRVYDPMLGADFGEIAAPGPGLVEQKTRFQSRPKTCHRDKQV